jgi:hypothetical protein
MKIIKNERPVFTDIDGTLIVHGPKQGIPTVQVYDPESCKYVTMGINRAMVKIVREEKARGAFIIAWSRGGYQWAKNVINALDLEEHTDIVMTKPLVYLDDIPVEKWLETRIFLSEDTVYKR